MHSSALAIFPRAQLMTSNRIEIDPALHRKYDVLGPRYTSYPTAPLFHERFTEAEYRRSVSETNGDPIPRSLSLYLHIPFCKSLCYYCACNKIITRHSENAATYLRYLEQELALHAGLFDTDREIRQLYLGGGTPTFLDNSQLRELIEIIRNVFTLAPAGWREQSIEVDPRAVDGETIATLGDVGFRRLSLGVQDFDRRVQASINRIQSLEQTQQVVDDARTNRFDTIGIDLIYGLPYQSVASFGRTLEQVVALNPDQLSIYNYAHLPERVRAQRLIRAEDLPSPAEKLEILAYAVAFLTGSGYRYIGMDHFARPDSDLARALDGGTLQRNFQGYSTHAECDLIGAGVTAISKIGDAYGQNIQGLHGYYNALERSRIPIRRGYVLCHDDRLRSAVIQALMCHSSLHFCAIEDRFDINFASYFAPELQSLKPLEEDGLVALHPSMIEVLPQGRFLLRNIAMVFDRYLKADAGIPPGRYSRTV